MKPSTGHRTDQHRIPPRLLDAHGRSHPGAPPSGRSAPGRRPSRRVDVGPPGTVTVVAEFRRRRRERGHRSETRTARRCPRGLSMVRPGTRRYPMSWWMLLVALGLAGCGPTLATLQRLAPVATAFVQANSGSTLTPPPYRGLDDPTPRRPPGRPPHASPTAGPLG